MRQKQKFVLASCLLILLYFPLVAFSQLSSGLAGASGSTIGPDGALYVTEGAIGEVTRIDRKTGEQSLFAENLPPLIPDFGYGGPVDVAFIDDTAYVLVSLTDPFAIGLVGGFEPQGIYRIDGPGSPTLVADLGAWSAANPPSNEFGLPAGVPYAIEPFRGGLLISDGHHDRVLWVGLDGTITEFYVGIDIVPTGFETWGHHVIVAQAGIIPHPPEDGKVVAVDAKNGQATEIASGARLAVDVEFGRGRTLYILSQGEWVSGFPGSPAMPGTGALFRRESDGSVTEVVGSLNLPTSLEIVGKMAYIVSLTGDVWAIELENAPPYGRR
jgi:hypothetical protein